MENQETILKLVGMEERESKAGRKYHSFQTSEGQMSCFESSVVDELRKRIGKQVKVIVAEKNGFRNIREFKGDVEIKPGEAPQQAIAPVVENKFTEARKEKNVSMFISYAKDLLVAGKVDNMATACMQIMQAKQIFEKNL